MKTIFPRLFRPTLAAALILCASAASAQQAVKFRTLPLNIGIHVIQAEAAATPAQREQGLMHREKMGPNQGMVFLFEGATTICMWMKNTLLPLSVAFIDEQGKIVNIADMQPQSTESHCGEKPVKYALEMNQGWFRQKNIKPGTLVDGLPR
ncbi:DUF192 domain-containing protein [Janthinobacterium sp. 17J80-10]|uniref:DUF192 domain-containing protein n=1 Tax=Janthinobacterium sp. 17J80-10 TaxID=2497863 RepID=UPI0010058D53|nr:DUF192 domain-containing protein [Janthinobacterium sp. 17J80-10]QAU35314.1 DUF192 domain-containing protein [Janthinobacterium sp. 17J80-10]